MKKFKFLLVFLLFITSGAWTNARQVARNHKCTKPDSPQSPAIADLRIKNVSTLTGADIISSALV